MYKNYVVKYLILKIFSEVCFIVKRNDAYWIYGGELKIHIDGTEKATYPDSYYGENRYCPEQIHYGDLITFDAVAQNDEVCSTCL